MNYKLFLFIFGKSLGQIAEGQQMLEEVWEGVKMGQVLSHGTNLLN